jgi:helix-turn-helix protein
MATLRDQHKADAQDHPKAQATSAFIAGLVRQFAEDVTELVRHVPARQLSRAQEEVSPLRRLSALVAGVVQFAPTADPLAAAQARAAARQSQLIEQAGGLLSPEEAAERIGMSRQTVSNWRRQGRLLAIPRGRRDFAYPAMQFGGGGVLPGIDLVLGASNLRDPWSQLGMLLTPAETLGGDTPLQALRVGRIDEAVRVARRAGAPLDEGAPAAPVLAAAKRASSGYRSASQPPTSSSASDRTPAPASPSELVRAPRGAR